MQATFRLMMKIFPDITEQDNYRKFTLNNISGEEIPVQEDVIQDLIRIIEARENVTFIYLELVYVDEDEIVRINKEHLNRDYITDIISFRYDESNNNAIEGTLFCCAQRIDEQSHEFATDPTTEFYRIIIHGLLHLAGYDDQTKKGKTEMTQLENETLEQINPSSY